MHFFSISLQQNGSNIIFVHQSIFFAEIYSLLDGPPPEINLANEKNNGETVLKLLDKNLIFSVHDVSAGGLLVALAEMSISSELGLKIGKPKKLSNLMEHFFSEDQGRYLIEIEKDNVEKVQKILKDNNIYNEIVASVQKKYFEIEGELKININDLCKANNKWYDNY